MGEHIRFSILMIAGLVAAMTIGKYVPHVIWLTERFSTTLGAVGFIVSGVMIPGALFGALLGRAVDFIGAKRAAIYGLVLLIFASLSVSLVDNFWQLLAIRFAEGLGYCILIVAATVLILQNSSARNRTMALSFWSSFAPVGFALGQWSSSYVEGAGRLALIGQGHAVLLCIPLILVLYTIPADIASHKVYSRADTLASLRHPPAFRLALAFGIVTGILLAVVALTPLVLSKLYEMPIQEIARLTALAALTGLLGRFASGLLLGYGVIPRNLFVATGLTGAVAITLCLQLPLPLGVALLLFALFQISVGAIPALLSAMMPHVVRTPGEMGTLSGLINQMVNLGNLLSPPLTLAIFAIAGAGIANSVLMVALAGAAMTVFSLTAFKSSHRAA